MNLKESLTPADIDAALDSIRILVDTREQDTPRSKKRLKGFRYPYKRQKLDYGDYSCSFTLCDVEIPNRQSIVSIERKMNLDELAACFTSGRGRFEREFYRAKEAGSHIHLIVENGGYEKIYHHQYKSRLTSTAFIASLMSWQARYNIQIHFCTTDATPLLISDIIRYELREYLKRYERAENDNIIES